MIVVVTAFLDGDQKEVLTGQRMQATL
jgi:hypothetical protein